jgi:pimeloyl-ACP methyl ester carboxylesterase
VLYRDNMFMSVCEGVGDEIKDQLVRRVHGKPAFAIIGCSMGGVLALRYAQMYPVTLSKASSCDAPGMTSLEVSKLKWKDRMDICVSQPGYRDTPQNVVVLIGNNDEAIGPKEILMEVASKVKGGRCVSMKDTGHIPPTDSAQALEKIVLDFFRSRHLIIHNLSSSVISGNPSATVRGRSA